MIFLDVWRWHIVSPIDTCIQIGAISDMMVQWSRLIIFFLMFSLDFIRLFFLFGLLLEFIKIPKHGFSVLEKKRDSSIKTTIRQIFMDHLVHLECKERQIFWWHFSNQNYTICFSWNGMLEESKPFKKERSILMSSKRTYWSNPLLYLKSWLVKFMDRLWHI